MSFTRFYYELKPLIPWRVRMAIRRWFALRKRDHVSDVWPIKPGSERPPDGWPGWPYGKRFAFVLTHDIEGPKGLERFKELAELEMSLGFRSLFNFIPEGSYRVSSESRQWLAERGFEVGVHDLNHDGKLYRSREGFRRKAARINQYVEDWNAAGFRSAFMHHNLEWLRDLAVQYDSSTFDTDPFEPQPDGVGTIFPFWVPGRSPGSGFVELPYTLAQDSTLFVLLSEESSALWKQKLDWIAEHGGMALLNVHPDCISLTGRQTRKDGEYSPVLYREFLEYVKEHFGGVCWHALPMEVAAYIRPYGSRLGLPEAVKLQFDPRTNNSSSDNGRLAA